MPTRRLLTQGLASSSSQGTPWGLSGDATTLMGSFKELPEDWQKRIENWRDSFLSDVLVITHPTRKNFKKQMRGPQKTLSYTATTSSPSYLRRKSQCCVEAAAHLL